MPRCQRGCQRRARQMLKKTKKTKKAERPKREHRPNRPTPRGMPRKRKPPTNPQTKNTPGAHTAKKRTEGKPRQRAQRGRCRPTRGHATPPARTNRTRRTTRTHEPRTRPRGTGQKPKRNNRPRDKDTKNTNTTDTAKPRKQPPQPRKKPPQPQKRSSAKRQKNSRKREKAHPESTRPAHPLYLKIPARPYKNRARRRKTARRRRAESGTLGGGLCRGCVLEEPPDLLPRSPPCGLAAIGEP